MSDQRVYNDSDMAFAILAHSAWERMLHETQQPAGPSPDRTPLLWEVGRQLGEKGAIIAPISAGNVLLGYHSMDFYRPNSVTMQPFLFVEFWWITHPGPDMDEKEAADREELQRPTSWLL